MKVTPLIYKYTEPIFSGCDHFIQFSSLVAAELARIHMNLPLETDIRSDPLVLTRTVFNNVPETLDDPAKQAR